VTIALVTSQGGKRGYPCNGAGVPPDRTLQRLAIVTTAIVYLQIVVGATMRHTGAGLAIPDFPLAFGDLLPPQWDAKIAIHFAHRAGALVVTALLLATFGHVFRNHFDRRELRRPALLLIVLLIVQLALGAFNIWTGLHFVINSLHVVTGASILVTSLVLTLRAHRARFAAEAALRDYMSSAGRVPPRADASRSKPADAERIRA
jgi:cytochrome c oxidase assembly protein subunit 15